MTKHENNNSAKKKLIPAVAMLTTSAVMLSTSTYAWFTMSREVEVNNIRMTATTPEDIQISLGTIGTNNSTPETDEKGKSLANSSGVLVYADGKTSADNGDVKAPTNFWDWSNSADISAYYDFGRLMPASSCDGKEIFFTPDASGVGKTVKANASYYQATNKLDTVADGGTGTNKTYKATLHALTAARDTDKWAEGGASGYSQAAAWNKTNDDGYYVDIPIWLRTSSNDDIKLSVDGYVLPASLNTGDGASNKETDLELYRAVRVAILDGDTGDAAVGDTNNIIPLKDAWDTSQNGATTENKVTYVDGSDYTGIWAKSNVWANENPSILDSLNYKRATVGNASMSETELYGVSEVSSNATDPDGNGISDTYAATYANYTAITPTSAASGWSEVATLTGSTTSNDYGAAKKLIIRVWLDGEDGECWNDNAGQDWAISLKFSKIDNSTTQGT